MSPNTISRAWRRYQGTGITWGELERAKEGQQHNSRTSICYWNRRSPSRALQNDFQQATGMHVSDQTVKNRLREGGMRAWRLVGPVFIAQHHAARLAFSREDQIRQGCHWSPGSIDYTLLSHDVSCSENPANWISFDFNVLLRFFSVNLNPALSRLMIFISIDLYVFLFSMYMYTMYNRYISRDFQLAWFNHQDPMWD